MLGEKWKQLTDKQKAPYEAKAATDKQRYADEKAAYEGVCSTSITSTATSLTFTQGGAADDDED